MQKQNQNVCSRWIGFMTDSETDRDWPRMRSERVRTRTIFLWNRLLLLNEWVSWQGTHKSHNWIFKAVKNEKRGLVSKESVVGKPHTIHNSLIRSDEGPTLETSAYESLYGGQLTIRPVARKGYGSIAHEAKPNGLLTRGPWGRRV